MGAADMDISVGGNTSAAVTQVDNLTKSLGTLSTAVSKIPAPFANSQKGIDAFQKSLSNITPVSEKAAAATTKLANTLNTNLKTGSNQAANSLQNFGRIIQDAPFGIIGITNNINPLLESFQRLKAETGSTGSAIKALAGGLVGGGGLGLAVSVVTSLLTVFALSSQGAGSSAEDLSANIGALKVDFDAAKKSADNFNTAIDSLRALRNVNLDIRFPGDGANALKRLDIGFAFDKQEEELKLKQLQDLEKKAEETRSRTFDLLQKKGSNALNSLVGSENTLNDVKKAGINLSSKDLQLLDAAISAEEKKFDILAQQDIQRNKINQLVGQNKLDIDEINKKEAERVKNILTVAKVLEKLRLELSYLSAKELTFKTDESKEKISEIEKAIETLVTKLNIDPNATLIKRLFGNINDLKLPAVFKAIADSARKERLEVPIYFNENQVGAALLEAIDNINKKYKGGTDIGVKIPVDIVTNTGFDSGRESLVKALESKGISTTDRTLENGLKIVIPIKIATTSELIASLKDFEVAAAAVKQRVADTVAGIMSDTISAVADGVADALTGGKDVVPRLFDSLMKGLGQQFKEFGQYLVKIGLEKLAIDKALEALKINPAATIAIGFATQILGSLLIAAANKKAGGLGQGFATGVRDFQGGAVVTVGERGPERIFLPSHSTVQPNNEMQAYGGGGITLQPSIHYEGAGFRIMLDRVDKQFGRNN